MRDRTTRLHVTNQVHPTAWIEEGVRVGENNYFGPHTYIAAGVSIGSGNRFEGFCSIGTPPEHRDRHLQQPVFSGPPVMIKDKSVFKEFVTVNRGMDNPTMIGNGVWMLRGSHAGHDSIIEDDATISCSVLIGGHSIIMRAANIGLGAVIHQKRTIGSLCMVGMNSTVTHSIPPFMTAFGSPCRAQHLNERGLVAFKYSRDDIRSLLDYEAAACDLKVLDLPIESPFRDDVERYLRWTKSE